MTAQELLEYRHEPYRQELVDGTLYEPDLAIEVVSPNDRRSDVDGKTLDWLASGTRAVVVLDRPLRTATVYRARDDIRGLTVDETLDLDDVVLGWSARVGDLFV
jgi:Uma2 family endonuclease